MMEPQARPECEMPRNAVWPGFHAGFHFHTPFPFSNSRSASERSPVNFVHAGA